MLRPWLAALALIVCALTSWVVFAWSVNFRAPEIVGELADAAAGMRLEGIAMSLHREAAELRRDEVRRLRENDASPAQRTTARHALADELRDAALLAETEGDLALSRAWMAEAVQAAPERADLLCLLTDLRQRGAEPGERRMALLRLVYEHDAPCALVLAGESFLEAGDSQAARAYFDRAAERAPRWAEPRLALAQIDLRAKDLSAARENAAEALALATDLRAELRAASLLRMSGGIAPPRWRLLARSAWQSYAWVLPSMGAFVVLLLSPTLMRLVRRGVVALRTQRTTVESAS